MRPQPLSRKLPQQRDRAGLALNFINLGQPSLALEYATKAYQLRDRANEREKLRISGTYFAATGELDKEAQTDELWTANWAMTHLLRL